MTRILIAVASSHGHTRTNGETIRDRLRAAGHTVELADVGQGAPAPDAYDAVVLGSRVQFDRHAPAMVDYVTRHRVALDARPSYFFSVSLSAGQPHAGPDPRRYMAKFFEQCAWRPRQHAAFGGGLHYRRYGRLLRLFMQQLSRFFHRPTDTSRDHVFTVWSTVARFADEIAADLSPQTLRALRN